MRTFIAIKIEPGEMLVEKLSVLKQELKGEPVKWVEGNNLHLTLKFIGETSAEQAEQIKQVLSSFAEQHKPISFKLSGLGFFKSRGMPRVLYVDIHEAEGLKGMAGRIETLLLPLGFQKEERPFSPHLTLGRIKFLKNKRRFIQAVETNQFTSDKSTTVKEIILFQSQLRPEGPVYNELAKFKLNQSE